MNLFKNPVVPATVDAAWVAQIPQLTTVSPSPVLVVTQPVAVGSKEETTLANMLKACGFGADDYALLLLGDGETLPWPRIAEMVSPQFALLLGVPPAALGITALLPPNTPAEFSSVTFIWTGTLQHLTESEAARKALWKDVLQPLFKGAQ